LKLGSKVERQMETKLCMNGKGEWWFGNMEGKYLQRQGLQMTVLGLTGLQAAFFGRCSLKTLGAR
jgi:hypothetical protein